MFGLRAAQHIASLNGKGFPKAPVAAIGRAIQSLVDDQISEDGLDWRDIQREVQARMSDHAGFLCSADGVFEALRQARELNARIRQHGVRYARAEEAPRALQWRQMALASEAVLTALDAYVASGGGSRGARAILDPKGTEAPATRLGALEAFRFRAERLEDRANKIVVRLAGDAFAWEKRPIRRRDRAKSAYFERDWGRFLSGAIFSDGAADG